MSVVYGASNVGKSFWTLDLCFHIATGRQWREGQPGGRYLVKKPGCIVYVAAEGGKGFYNRVAALKRRFAVADDAAVPIEIIPCPVDLTKAGADVPELLQHIEEAGQATGQPVVMVVIDTLSRAMQGADENQAPDMTAFVGNIDRIRNDAPTPHVMIVHHSGKDTSKGLRGHSSLRAATDTEIELVRKGEGADKSASAIVRKQRDLAGEDVLPFTLATIALGHDDDDEPVTSAVIEHLAELPSAAAADDFKAPKPKDQAAQALDVLLTMDGSAKSLPGVPKGATAVKIKDWREAVFDAGIVGDQDTNPGTKRTRWDRLMAKLLGGGQIKVARDWVWMPGGGSLADLLSGHEG